MCRYIEKIITNVEIRFLFFGGMSAFVNIALFYMIVKSGVDYNIANVIAIISAKITAYFILKRFVFYSPFEGIYKFTCEFIRFVFSRLFTSLIDFFGVLICVEVFLQNSLYAKIEMGIISTVLNYLISRYFVFSK